MVVTVNDSAMMVIVVDVFIVFFLVVWVVLVAWEFYFGDVVYPVVS